MQQDTRGRGDVAPPIETMRPDGVGADRAGGTLSAPGLGGRASVADVPSEQLWRAAVLAAREAAITAAELRRSLERRRGG